MGTIDTKFEVLLTRLRFSLMFPFITLIVITVFVISLMLYSAFKLNDYSENTSQALFASVLKKEYEDLGKLTKDYSFWDDAVKALFVEFDQEFVDENFLGPYLTDAFDVTKVAIFKPDGSILFSVDQGELEDVSTLEFNAEIHTLINSVASTNMLDPTPSTGIMRIDDNLYNVAVAAITPFDRSPSLDINRVYGFIVMAQPFDQNKISKWMSDYNFQKMQLQMMPNILDKQYIHHPFTSPSGAWLANIIWQPNHPGTELINKVQFWLIGLLLFMFVMAWAFSVQIRKFTTMTVNSAVELEDIHKQLEKAAYYDPITNLPNRSLAMDRLTQSLSSGHRKNSLTSVLFVDLDDFKPINDLKGHDVGDQVLMMVGERMQSCIRENDTASRIGGDEFIIILNDLKHPDDAGIVANKINEKLNRGFVVDADKLTLSASIGIAMAPTDTNDPKQLIKYADDAMYEAKNNGKNTSKFFTKGKVITCDFSDKESDTSNRGE